MPRTGKGMNPEERLQASVAHDLKLADLEEHARRQGDILAAAKWEVSFNEKEIKAAKQRMNNQIIADSNVAKITNTLYRRQRLEQLYQDDELRYEEELRVKGLAFRRERL
eukprot:gene4200-4614_t